MSAVLRVIDTGVAPARWNVAITAALMQRHRANVGCVLRFHRTKRVMLLGRHQALDHELDVDCCRRQGVEIARRITGGGTIYMGPGVLAWDLFAGRRAFGLRLDDASGLVGSMIADGLSRLGVAAHVGTAGDIVVGGRKVAGTAGCFDGSAMVTQGSILIDFKPAEIAGLLRCDSQTRRNSVPVTNLAQLLGRMPEMAEIQEALVAATSEALGASVKRDTLGPDEIALAQHLCSQEIGTDAFVLGDAADELLMRRAS